MKYIVREGTADGEYNASSKARNDVDTILNSLGCQPLFVKTKYGVQKQKWKKPLQLIIYKENLSIWKETVNNLKSGDVVYIQYPLLNTTYGFNDALKLFKEKNIRTVAVIHDMDSLRFTEELDGIRVVKRVHKEDTEFLPAFTRIICHNEKMKKELVRYGVDPSKITCLGIFDYLGSYSPKKHEANAHVIIAGNLNKNKVQYLKYLKEINYDFNLYGIGYEDENADNIHYKGAFKPEELLDHLEGAFGLVWDGKSKDGCRGGWGDYLKYNNPHKASLYIAAGIPVVTWKESAIASFILENNIGVLISDLSQIEELGAVGSEKYNEMCENCRKLSLKVQTGYFLKKAVAECEK